MTKTYAQLAREIAALKAVAEKQLALEIKDAVAKINEVIAKYGLAAGDLTFPVEPQLSPPSATPAKRRRPSSKAAAFNDGQGNVWSGRGPRPAWVRSALAAGRSLESLRSSSGTGATAAAIAPARKAAASVAPKYRDPASGSTWSGRGPQPQWLKKALKKRGSAIEDFLISEAAAPEASLATSASPKPASKPFKAAQRVQKGMPDAKPLEKEQAAASKGAVKKAAAQAAAKRASAQSEAGAAPERALMKKPARKAAAQPLARKKPAARKAYNAPATALAAAAQPGHEAPAGESPAAKEGALATQPPVEMAAPAEPMVSTGTAATATAPVAEGDEVSLAG